jgi:hypothetical protein
MSAHRSRATTGALVTAILALGGLAGLAGCGPRPATGVPAGDPPVTAGDPSTGTAPTTPAGGGTATRVSLAVYYLGTERAWREDDGSPIDRVKLYREFHRLPAGDGGARARTVAAVTAMLTASADDPHYRTGWPDSARVRDVRVDPGLVTVDLGGARRNNVGAEAAEQAVQQLAWTATAASGESRVRLLLDGERVDELWGHVAIDGPLRRAAAEDVLAHVWLIDPQHGATVGRTFTVHVSGYVHEATIHIRVRQGDRTVRTTFVTVASDGGLIGEARTRLTLPAGRYTIEAYAPDQTGSGRPLFLDDHAVTVR